MKIIHAIRKTAVRKYDLTVVEVVVTTAILGYDSINAFAPNNPIPVKAIPITTNGLSIKKKIKMIAMMPNPMPPTKAYLPFSDDSMNLLPLEEVLILDSDSAFCPFRPPESEKDVMNLPPGLSSSSEFVIYASLFRLTGV
jgi:hypothetical protein